MSLKDRGIVARWTIRLRIRRALLAAALKRHASFALISRRKAQVAYAERVILRHHGRIPPVHPRRQSLAQRAHSNAVSQLGVSEATGNNDGVPYERYEKPNGAPGHEPWCGDFQAWCYRKAGSKSVVRAWASVPLLGRLSGLVSVPVRDARLGDLVRYDWNDDGVADHVEQFEQWVDRGTSFLAIGGNASDEVKRSLRFVSDLAHTDPVKRVLR